MFFFFSFLISIPLILLLIILIIIIHDYVLWCYYRCRRRFRYIDLNIDEVEKVEAWAKKGYKYFWKTESYPTWLLSRLINERRSASLIYVVLKYNVDYEVTYWRSLKVEGIFNCVRRKSYFVITPCYAVRDSFIKWGEEKMSDEIGQRLQAITKLPICRPLHYYIVVLSFWMEMENEKKQRLLRVSFATCIEAIRKRQKSNSYRNKVIVRKLEKCVRARLPQLLDPSCRGLK